MGLNLGNTGDFKGHIRYMASTSSWSMSVKDSKEQKNFVFTQAVIDLEKIKTGWGLFPEGQAPKWVMDASLTQPATKPADEAGQSYKRGFKVDVFSKSLFGDEPVREFATSATGAVMGIQALYEQFEKELPNNKGSVPVVEFKGAIPTKVGKGNTTVPTLVIVKWIPRPAELDAVETKQSAPAPTAPAVSASEF